MTLNSLNSSQEQARNPLFAIGPEHGYRIEGDRAFIHAELQVPPFASGDARSLELWACDQPHEAGPLTGVRVAALDVDLPTPLVPYLHRVDAQTAARLPLQGRAYSMVLALLRHDRNGQSHVQAFANYDRPQSFNSPHFDGRVGYAVQGKEVVLEADAIFNPRSDNLSGTLALELWAFPVSGDAAGSRLATVELAPLAGGAHTVGVNLRVPFSEPPAGQYRLALQLCEWTATDGYVARDQRDFECLYDRAAETKVELAHAETKVEPARAETKVEPAHAETKVEPARAETKVEPVRSETKVEPARAETKVEPARAEPNAEPARAETKVEPPRAEAKVEPVRSDRSGRISVNSGSVEQLANVKGLNLKLAKAIAAARPFASLDDLTQVRGIGAKTLERLKSLLKL